MNPLVTQLVSKQVRESVVPVPATVPRKSLRRRAEERRRRAGAAQAMTEDVDNEPSDATVIPADALKTSTTGTPIAGEKPLVKAPSEPENPYAEQNPEELMTPAVALVAPDVTPKAFYPLDLSLVPGYAEVKFTTREAEAAKAEPVNALNVLLGRPAAAPAAAPVAPAAAPVVPAPPPVAAESMLAAMTAEDKVTQAMTPAAPGTCTMPEHKPSDGRPLMEAFRRFAGARQG
jgi:hypothetical protein